jgi:hypothetical protein
VLADPILSDTAALTALACQVAQAIESGGRSWPLFHSDTDSA